MSKQSRRRSRRHKQRHQPASRPFAGYSAPDWSYYGPYRGLDAAGPQPVVPSRTDAEWQQFVDRVQRDARLTELGLTAHRLPGKSDVRIYETQTPAIASAGPTRRRLAIVCDGAAMVDGHDRIAGDFLSDGPHWDLLHDALSSLVGTPKPHAIEDEQVTAAPPSGASPRLVERAIEASRVIGGDVVPLVRQVVLPGPQFTVTFWPPVEQDSIRGLPFAYQPHDGASISGRLCLLQHRTGDLVPVAAATGLDPEALWTAWVVALCELVRFIEIAARPLDRDPAVRPEDPSQQLRRAVSSAYVRPFVRRLPDGQQHSPEALANARVRGVELGEGETLVKEHVRKGADHEPLRIEQWISSIDLDEVRAQLPRAA